MRTKKEIDDIVKKKMKCAEENGLILENIV